MAKVDLYTQQIQYKTATTSTAMFVGGRGTGKTFVAREDIIELLTLGYDILAGAPTYKQLKQVLFKNIIESLAFHKIRYTVNYSEMIIRALGCEIFGTSNESYENARGYTVGALVVDEAAKCKEEAIEIWIACCRGHHTPKYRYISTARGKNNWMYRYSLMDDTTVIYAKMEDNPFTPDAWKKQMRTYYGDTDFAKQELDGKFVTFNAGYFETKHIKIVETMSIQTMVMAWDLAFTDKKNSDYTANVIAGVDYDGNFCVIHAERWQFKAPETKDIIKDRIEQVACPALVEVNGGGRVIFDDLVVDKAMRSANLIPVTASTSKVSRGVGLSSAMQRGEVVFKNATWNQWVIDELSEFAIDDTHEHDDGIDAMVMCYNYLKYGSAKGMDIKGIM